MGGFFAQKSPNLAQNWHFWSIWARPCRLIWCPVGWSVGGCGARAVSRKTPIYFILFVEAKNDNQEHPKFHLFNTLTLPEDSTTTYRGAQQVLLGMAVW